VLLKLPNTNKIAKDHIFKYNTGFINQLFKIKIPTLAAKVSTEATAKKEVPPSVLEARKNRVEAAVVRIMKARKTLDHNNLIAEVVKQLSARFAVEPTFIKKRIESLIEREYLSRDKDNRRIYHYMA